MEVERERVKFIHLKPILFKLISGLYGLNRLMTSNLKAGKKVSFVLKLLFVVVFSLKQIKKNSILGFQTFTWTV